MKFTSSAARLLAFAALQTVNLVSAEDVLYSRRMAKRGLDAQGNYNICKLHYLKAIF
jgi:5'-nucleotidase